MGWWGGGGGGDVGFMHQESDVRSSRLVMEATQYRFDLKIYLKTGVQSLSPPPLPPRRLTCRNCNFRLP